MPPVWTVLNLELDESSWMVTLHCISFQCHLSEVVMTTGEAWLTKHDTQWSSHLKPWTITAHSLYYIQGNWVNVLFVTKNRKINRNNNIIHNSVQLQCMCTCRKYIRTTCRISWSKLHLYCSPCLNCRPGRWFTKCRYNKQLVSYTRTKSENSESARTLNKRNLIYLHSWSVLYPRVPTVVDCALSPNSI